MTERQYGCMPPTTGSYHYGNGSSYQRSKLVYIPEHLLPKHLRLTHKWPLPTTRAQWHKYFIMSVFIVPVAGFFSRIWLNWMNNVTVHNLSTLEWWVNERPLDLPLITVSNHHSCLDDPLIYAVLPLKAVASAAVMRWSLAAHDIVFTYSITSWLFARGKCVPVVRGLGVHQRGMDFCVERLREGRWVHVFPEGKVNEKHEHLRFKWGVGRLVYDCWAGYDAPAHQDETVHATAATRSFFGLLKECSTKLGALLGLGKSGGEIINANSGVNTGMIAADSGDDYTKTSDSGGSEFVNNENSAYENINKADYDSKRNSFNNNTEVNSRTFERIVSEDDGECSLAQMIVSGYDDENLSGRMPGRVPVVLPIYHVGMDSILPNSKPYIPRVGRHVTLVVGTPLDLRAEVARLNYRGVCRREARRAITQRIQDEMRALRSRAEALHYKHLAGRT